MSQINRLSAVAAVAILVGSTGFHAVQAQQPLQVTVDPNNVWIRAGESPILRYRHGDVPFKPYVKELYTPSGLNVLLDAPPDHLHHHALMFAVAVDGVNFWEETPTAGRQRGGNDISILHNRGSVGPNVEFTTTPVWHSPTAVTPSLFESRAIKVSQAGGLGATAIIWQSQLHNRPSRRSPQSKVLSGSHYFGLGMRFVRSMDGGEFFNADGKDGTIFRGEERLVQSNWCAYTATIDGRPVTVAMLGHPDNPRHPTTWFTMAKPFAYLSGTLNLHEQPLSVEVGKPLVVRYAILAWDGKVAKDRIDQAYHWFTSECPATPPLYQRSTENDPNG